MLVLYTVIIICCTAVNGSPNLVLHVVWAARNVLSAMVVFLCHYPLSSTCSSWDTPFAGHQEVYPVLDDMLPVLVFALACADSPERISELFLALSQNLGH